MLERAGPVTVGIDPECLRADTRSPRSRGSRPVDDHRRAGINLAIRVWSQCCACRFTACASSLSELFDGGRHGQESKEGKEDREGSHQEGGKEDVQEEVISSTTIRLPPPGHPAARATSSKGSEIPSRPSRVSRQQWQSRTFVQVTAAQRSGFCLDLPPGPNGQQTFKSGVPLPAPAFIRQAHPRSARGSASD